jgi:hypothetical protein
MARGLEDISDVTIHSAAVIDIRFHGRIRLEGDQYGRG